MNIGLRLPALAGLIALSAHLADAQLPDTVWEQASWDYGLENHHGRFFVPDGDGYILSGVRRRTDSSRTFLFKADAQGALIWKRYYDLGLDEYAPTLMRTRSGELMMAGWVTNHSAEFFVMKAAANGDSLWLRNYGLGWGRYILENPDGTFIAGGSIRRSGYQACLLKLDADGDTLWTRTYAQGQVHHIIPAPGGGYFLAGSADSTFMARTDADGNLLWWKSLNGQAVADYNKVIAVSDNRYLFIGGESDDTDVYLFDSTGARIWHRLLGKGYGVAGTVAYDVLVENPNSFVLTGGRQNTITRLDSLGNIKWARNLSYGYGHDILKAADGSYMIYGNLGESGSGIILSKVALNPPPSFEPLPIPFPGLAYEDARYAFQPKAVDAFPNDKVKFKLASPPKFNLAVDSLSGLLTWTPAYFDTGSNPLKMVAWDRLNQADTLEFAIRVLPVNDPPKIDTLLVNKPRFTPGDTVRLSSKVTDEEGDSVFYRWVKNGRDSLGLGDKAQYLAGAGTDRWDTLQLFAHDRKDTSVKVIYVRIGNPPVAAAPGRNPEGISIQPVNGGIHIRFQADAEGTVALYTLQGAKVLERAIGRPGDSQLPISLRANPGLYVLRARSRSIGRFERILYIR